MNKINNTWLMKFIRWVSTSFQTETGKVCSKRITASAITLLIIFVSIFYFDKPNYIPALGTLGGLLLALLGVKDYFETKKLKNGTTTSIKKEE